MYIYIRECSFRHFFFLFDLSLSLRYTRLLNDGAKGLVEVVRMVEAVAIAGDGEGNDFGVHGSRIGTGTGAWARNNFAILKADHVSDKLGYWDGLGFESEFALGHGLL